MMNEHGSYVPEEALNRPDRPEFDVENREAAEAAAERIKAVETAANDADRGIFDNAASRLEAAAIRNGVTMKECARSAEVREAIRELGDIQAETAEKTDKARHKLNGLKARLKRSAVGAAVMLAAMAAELPAAKASPPGPEAAQAGLLLEGGERARPPFAEVKRRMIEHVKNDAELAAELGESNMAALREALERFDAAAVNAALAELAGVDPSRTAGETPFEINILSEAEFERLKAKNRLLTDDTGGWHSDDRIFVRPAKRLRNDGLLRAADLLATLSHEQIHAAYTKGLGANFGRESGITATVHEGTTEWLNTLILARLGVEDHRQAYGGGTVATAFMLEQILGTEKLARLHLEGKLEDLEDALTEKLGKDAADSIMSVSINNPYFFETGSSNAEAMLTALEVAQRAKLAGMDVVKLGENTADFGLQERMQISEDANTVILTTESRQKGMYQNLIHDTGIRLTPNGFSFKISIDTFEPIGRPVEDTLYKTRLRAVRNISENVQRRYDEAYDRTQRTPESDDEFQAYLNMRRSTFTLTIPAPESIFQLQERHKNAATAEERTAIENESSRILRETAEQAAAQIRARLMSAE